MGRTKRERRGPDARMGAADIVVLLASSCYWAWFDSATFRPTLFMPFSGSETYTSLCFLITLASGAVILLVAAIMPAWFKARVGGGRNQGIAVGAAVCGNGLTVLGAFLGKPPLLIAGAIAAGAACSFLLLGWARLYSRQGAKSASLLIAAGIALAAFIDILIIGLSPAFAAAFTIFLPVLSLIIMVVGKKMVGDVESSKPSVVLPIREIFSSTHVRFFGLSLSLTAAFFIFGFSFGFMQYNSSFSPTELYPFTSDILLIARGVTAAIIFFAMYFFPQRTYTVFRIGILVGIAGFIAVPFLSMLGNNGLITGFAIEAGYTAFDIITWTILAELAFATDKDAVTTFAPGRFMVHAAIVAGFAVAAFFLSNTMLSAYREALSTTVGYLLVVAEMLLLGENSALWMLVRSSTSSQDSCITVDADGRQVGLASRNLAQVAQRYGLTDRESDILRYLVMGRSRPRIAQILCISENTVNSHVQHIYRKLDVHGQQDLIDRFV